MGDRHPFDWHVLIDGQRVDVRAVRGSDNVTLAKGVIGDAKVTILGGNWPTHEALHLVTITDLSPYIEERKRIIGF